MTALTAAQRSARARARRRESGTAELRMQITPGLRQMLADLQQWHDIEEQAEAIQLLILNAHAAGPAGSAPLLAVPRHEYTPSAAVTRTLRAAAQQQDDDDE